MQTQLVITKKAVNNTPQLSLLLLDSLAHNTTSFVAMVRCQIALFPKRMTTFLKNLCVQYIPQCLVSLVLPQHAWIHGQHPYFIWRHPLKKLNVRGSIRQRYDAVFFMKSVNKVNRIGIFRMTESLIVFEEQPVSL